MSKYRRILAASALRGQSDRVIACAAEIARGVDGALYLAHFVQPLPLMYGGEFPKVMQEIHTGVRSEARSRLMEAARAHGVPAERCHLGEGSASAEIRRFAKELGADLVVVGTHRRHGLDFFLGSTSNAVLHDDSFDVLAVRIERPDD